MTRSLPGNRTVRIGLVLFVLGLVLIAVDVLPFFLGDRNRPLWLNLACLAAPLGFALAVGSPLRRGRAEQRAAAQAVHGTMNSHVSTPEGGSPG